MTPQEALIALLALPDPPELRRRAHYYTYLWPRGVNRERIKRNLGTAYVQRRRHDHGVDISGIVSARVRQRLRMVKRS